MISIPERVDRLRLRVRLLELARLRPRAVLAGAEEEVRRGRLAQVQHWFESTMRAVRPFRVPHKVP